MHESRKNAKSDIAFDRSFPGAPGKLERLSPLVRRMAAGNAGRMTFTGTCTYVVGAGAVAIIDPGPDRKDHMEALLDALRGETVAAILVTHTHKDHSSGARMLQRATGARVIGCAAFAATAFAADGMRLEGAHDASYAPDAILRDGEAFEARDFALIGVATPGHTMNHMAFFLPQEKALFSGDHVMAWATSLVTPPDGSMRDYMASLEKLRRRDDRIYWPGHGGPVCEPQRYVRALANHRRQRERAILARVEMGDATVEAIADHVYRDVSPGLRLAAGLSVLAHLQDLVERGIVAADAGAATLSGRYRRI